MSHVGLIAAGIFTNDAVALKGASYQMVSHGINAVGLFFIADILIKRFKEAEMNETGGLAHQSRPFAVGFMIIMLGSVALPLTNGFIGEFLLLSGIFDYSALTAAFAGLSVILGAVYMLNAYRMINLGDKSALSASFEPLTRNETALLAIICLLVIVGGVYPKPLLDLAAPAIDSIVSSAGV
jgi:NADH-quinone oxidoreductase subunit M